jgi:metal-responsive CopG/Arc/MetJ family transcriptional regulator
MRRIQVYLDDELLDAMQEQAHKDKTSVSALMRKILRGRYLTPHRSAEQCRTALMGIVGLWKNRKDLPDTETYIRNLRRGARRQRGARNG